MKPHTFFRLMLFIPYILWVICAIVVIPLTNSNLELSEAWNVILIPVMFYMIGIILWFFPYTILAIALWIWSANRLTTALRNAALFSPILLSVLMVIGTGALYLLTNDLAGFVKDIASMSLMYGVLSMAFGYLCVGIGFGTYKLAQARNLIDLSTPPPLEKLSD